MEFRYLNDVFEAGNIGEAIGHPVRIATIRILREAPNHEMTVMDILSEIRKKYNYDIPYGTFVAHIRKLEMEEICKSSKIGKLNSLKLIRDFEIVEVV